MTRTEELLAALGLAPEQAAEGRLFRSVAVQDFNGHGGYDGRCRWKANDGIDLRVLQDAAQVRGCNDAEIIMVQKRVGEGRYELRAKLAAQAVEARAI